MILVRDEISTTDIDYHGVNIVTFRSRNAPIYCRSGALDIYMSGLTENSAGVNMIGISTIATS